MPDLGLDERKPLSIHGLSFPTGVDIEEKLRFLLRYTILAPTSHNTQPWKFSLDYNTVDVFGDRDRWLRVADSDKRELYMSIGCSLENFLIAATGTLSVGRGGAEGSETKR